MERTFASSSHATLMQRFGTYRLSTNRLPTRSYRLRAKLEPKRRPAEADESLAALLARRDHVRSTQIARPVEPSPDLFKPERPVTISEPTSEKREEVKIDTAPEPVKEQSATVTSRLLAAKKKAQKEHQKGT